MPALLKLKRSIENGVWRLNFSLDPASLSEDDKSRMRKYGEPQLNAGGTYSFTASAPLVIPNITWANPLGLRYGTPLSGTQLNAAADVPGTFSYSPAADTILSAGTHQLTVTFTPTDVSHNQVVTHKASITVVKADPIITWATPVGITNPEALSSIQLNATASVEGSFSYNFAPGTVLPASDGTVLTATFTPTDTANYNTVTKSVLLVVAPANPGVDTVLPAGTLPTPSTPAALTVDPPVTQDVITPTYPTVTVVLPNKYIRVRSDLPFIQEFDSKSPDFATDTQLHAQSYQAVFEAAFVAAFTALRTTVDTFTGEFITNV